MDITGFITGWYFQDIRSNDLLQYATACLAIVSLTPGITVKPDGSSVSGRNLVVPFYDVMQA